MSKSKVQQINELAMDFTTALEEIDTAGMLEAFDALRELIFKPGEPYIFYPKENLIPPIEKIIFNPPATIVFWDDGEKTVVKCKESEEFDYECGLAFAIAKRYFSSRSEFKKAIRKAKKIANDLDSNKDVRSFKPKHSFKQKYAIPHYNIL